MREETVTNGDNLITLTQPKHFDKIFASIIIVIAIGLSAGVFIAFFQMIPIESGAIAIDWKKIWPMLEGGTIEYRAGYLMNPPWSVLLVAPLGLLPMRTSWGLLAFITTTVLILSVPRIRKKRRYWLSVLLLVLSYPALRHMIDGNFEVLIIGGALLTLSGIRSRRPFPLALGLLLLSSKPQSGTLVIAAVCLYALMYWQQERELWLKTAAIMLCIIIPSMLWSGRPWLEAMVNIPERTSIMNMSLSAALSRTGGIPEVAVTLVWFALACTTLVVMWKTRATLTRDKVAFLLAASLLLAPYSSGNSHVTILAIGIIPLFQKRPLMGGILIAMTAFPILWNETLLFNYSAYYATSVMLIMWAASGLQLRTSVVSNSNNTLSATPMSMIRG